MSGIGRGSRVAWGTVLESDSFLEFLLSATATCHENLSRGVFFFLVVHEAHVMIQRSVNSCLIIVNLKRSRSNSRLDGEGLQFGVLTVL